MENVDELEGKQSEKLAKFIIESFEGTVDVLKE